MSSMPGEPDRLTSGAGLFNTPFLRRNGLLCSRPHRVTKGVGAMRLALKITLAGAAAAALGVESKGVVYDDHHCNLYSEQ